MVKRLSIVLHLLILCSVTAVASDEVGMKIKNKKVAKELETTMSFSNKTCRQISGKVRWKVFDSLSTVVQSVARNIVLQSEAGQVHDEVFKVALSPGAYRVICYFTSEDPSLKLKRETYYLTVDHLNIPVTKAAEPKIKYVISDAYRTTAGSRPTEGFVKDRLNQFLHVRFDKLSGEAILEEDNIKQDKRDSLSMSAGKYLSAASMVWKFTQDEQLKKQIDSLSYAFCHTQREDGFLGVRNTASSFNGRDLEGIKNNIAGLLSYYAATGYSPALKSAIKAGDLVVAQFNEEGGNRKLYQLGALAATAIMDPMIGLYIQTGNQRYIQFCYNSIKEIEKPGHVRLLSSLANDGKFDFVDIRMQDVLTNLIAVLKIYRLTGNESYLKPCKAAWEGIVNDPSLLQIDSKKAERLDALNSWTLFNAQFALASGEISYFNQIDKAVFQSKSPALQPFYPLGILDNHPVIVSYETGNFKDQLLTYDGSKVELDVKQDSRYPKEGNVSLILNPSKDASFTLSLRRPARSLYYKAIVAGQTYTVSPNHFLNIQRFWKKGDQINIQFEMLPDYVTGKQEDAAYQKEETDQAVTDSKVKIRHQIRRSW